MTERQIDEAIDGAVRDLMDVDADPAFRARVLSRLEHPARRVGWFRLAAVTAGAAAIVVALLLTREPAPAPSIVRNEPARTAAPVSPQPPSIDGAQQAPAPRPQRERGTRARPA